MSKDRLKSATISPATLKRTLSRERAEPQLEAQEERALRMRNGLSAGGDMALPQKAAAGSPAAAQLAELEAQIFARYRQHVAETEGLDDDPSPSPSPSDSTPVDQRAKSKIIRALRRKG